MQISLKELGSTTENAKSVLVIDEEKLAALIRKKSANIPKPIPGECMLAHWKCSPTELSRYLSQNAKSFLSITKE